MIKTETEFLDSLRACAEWMNNHPEDSDDLSYLLSYLKREALDEVLPTLEYWAQSISSD